MTTTNENQDFEQMKSQLEAIKAKLDEQKLVSDSMIEKIIHDKASFLNSLDIISIVVLALAIPLFLYKLPRHGNTWWFTGYTMFVCIIGIITTLIDRKLSHNYQRNGSIEEYAINIAKTKKRFIIGTYFSIFLIVSFFGFYVYEELAVIKVSPDNMYSSYLALAVGITLGTWLTIKQWRALKTIQEQIDKLNKD